MLVRSASVGREHNLDTSFQTLVSLLMVLGIGGVIGAYSQSLFQHRKGIKEQEHELKRTRYACILILMLTELDPRTGLRHMRESRPDLQDPSDIQKEIEVELLNSVLFAGDDVIKSISEFARNPTYSSYVKVATSMRRDLWGKKTSVNEQTFDLLRQLK